MSKSILARLTDGTIQLTITIPQDEVKKAYDEVLTETVAKTELPGFRKGKAPKKLVEEKIDKSKIYEQVLQKLIPQAYLEAVEEHKLKPILSPKVELLKAKEGENWEIRATTCERPEVELGDYKKQISKELAPAKLWTPDTNPATTPLRPTSPEEKTQKVTQILLQTAKVNLPTILLEDELNRALASLVSQTEKLGLTIDQYLTSIGKNVEQLRAEYRQRVENDLKLQLILDAIVSQENIEVKEEDIDGLITAPGDQKLKENLSSPLSRAYLREILARRQALDFLVKL